MFSPPFLNYRIFIAPSEICAIKNPHPQRFFKDESIASCYHLNSSVPHGADLCKYGRFLRYFDAVMGAPIVAYATNMQSVRGSKTIFNHAFCTSFPPPEVLCDISHSLLFSSSPLQFSIMLLPELRNVNTFFLFSISFIFISAYSLSLYLALHFAKMTIYPE